MPKYYDYMVAGYYLYFTSYCTVECMHVHASDRELTERGSAKFFVRDNGDTVLQNRGRLNDREILKIQKFPESVKLIVFIYQSTIRLAKSRKCTLIMLNKPVLM